MKIAVLFPVSAAMVLAGCSGTHLTAQAPACPVRMAATPAPLGDGTVVKVLRQSEAMALLSHTQATVGAPIESSYVNNVRVLIRLADGSNRTVLVPYDMTVVLGDHVTYQGSYHSPAPLCSYVPMLVTSKL